MPHPIIIRATAPTRAICRQKKLIVIGKLSKVFRSSGSHPIPRTDVQAVSGLEVFRFPCNSWHSCPGRRRRPTYQIKKPIAIEILSQVFRSSGSHAIPGTAVQDVERDSGIGRGSRRQEDSAQARQANTPAANSSRAPQTKGYEAAQATTCAVVEMTKCLTF
jgi:hypothetical protein